MHLYFLIVLVMNVLYCILSCLYKPYDIVLSCVMIIRIRLKETSFGSLCFQMPQNWIYACSPFYNLNSKWLGWWQRHINCLVRILLGNLEFLTLVFLCHLQRMSSGNIIIFVEFLVLHWHFDSMLNTSVMTARTTMRVYIFHSRQFRSLVLSLFFCLH